MFKLCKPILIPFHLHFTFLNSIVSSKDNLRSDRQLWSGWNVKRLVSFKVLLHCESNWFRCRFRHVWWCWGYYTLIHSLRCLRLTQTFFASQEICIAGCVRQFNCNFFPFVFWFLFLMFGIVVYFTLVSFILGIFGIKKENIVQCSVKTVFSSS